jgi:hypothetical protein
MPSTTGSYPWLIPNTPSNLCKLRITDVTDSLVSDTSNNVFTITRPTITITSPNGGETWKVGSNHNITWTSTNVDSVQIQYSTDNGVVWNVIANSIFATIGTYNWTIPNTPSNQVLIRILDKVNPLAVIDTSDNNFRIVLPIITLLTPNGGETIFSGENYNITWSSNFVDSLRIDYSTNNGLNWINIISSTSSASPYSWFVPFTPSANCKVRIIDVSNPIFRDTSNNVFTIIQPTITISSPIGGESWQSTSTQQISWDWSYVDSVKIDYSTNNGSSWIAVNPRLIASAQPYSWIIPSTPSNQCLVRILKLSNPLIGDTSGVFTIYNSTISVVSPNGGENWRGGEPYEINWTSTNVANVKIEYSTNSGVNWILVNSSYPSTTGSYTWMIPDTPSTNCRVRISDASNLNISDTSNNDFTIYRSSVTLTQPNGGEFWRAGSSQSINWISSNINYVRIDYSTDNGVNWINVAPAIQANLGTYNWSVPNTPSVNCKVRLIETSVKGIVGDTSNAVFTIYRPSITVLLPNGGENWYGGSTQNITWNAINSGNVNLEFTTNNGTTWQSIASNIAPALGSYSWLVPNSHSSNCKIRILEAGYPDIGDTSDGLFTISSLKLTSPNGGETWQATSYKNISWNVLTLTSGKEEKGDDQDLVTNVKIDFSSNNGLNWTNIAPSVPLASGSYNWQVSNISSNNCLIRILDAANPNVGDTSDASFSIYQSTISVVFPNGAESLRVKTPTNITWNFTNLSKVKLEYSLNNGLNWITITDSTSASDLSYIWTTPDSLSDNCRIRISDVYNPLILDYNDNPFTLYRPIITVLTPNGGELIQVGKLYNITWTNSNVTTVKIDYTYDNGNTWVTVIDSVSAALGLYNWTVPNTPTMNARIRILEKGYPIFGDSSNSVFTLYRPTLTLTSPNGGELWRINKVYNITWSSTYVGNVKIDYSTNNGLNWLPVINSTPSTGSYAWTIPNTPSTQCKVRLIDVDNPGIWDTSANVFTLYNPSITVVTPNGGELWQVGTIQSISWSSSNVQTLRIDYSTDNGLNWLNISTATPTGSGSFNWIIPNTTSIQCKVRLLDTSDVTVGDTSNSVFTIFQPQIVVTSPNGGETWVVGTQKNITWTSGYVANVKIEYSTNNGNNWINIINSTPANTGLYSWLIPNTASNQCKVRIIDTSAPSIGDSSNNTFTIQLPTLILNSPNGGENWKIGTVQNITWTSTYISTVVLDYTTNNGSSWINITQSTPASLGVFAWTIPNTPSNQCKVRIMDSTLTYIIDSSNNVFRIYFPAVTVTTPNGGETWQAGSTQSISWTSNDVINVKLEYSTNNGISWSLINGNVPASLGSFSWLIPNTPSNQCRVKISDVVDPSIKDSSNNPFFIISPAIILTIPNGGEYWRVGTTQQIQWIATNSVNIKIDYSTNSGNTWINIAASIPAAQGQYNWVIPNTTSINCKVRIIDLISSQFGDTSDNMFTIYQPNLIVTSPNGGEIWKAGTIQNITWTSNNVVKVNIDYTTNNGTTWQQIDTGIVSALGNYAWVVPNSQSTNCKVKIYDQSLSILADTSNNPFTILLPSVQVTSPNGGENWMTGKTENITWTSTNVTNVKIEYTTNNGATWTVVSTSTPASSGSYAWIIPNTPSTLCKVKVSDASLLQFNDISDTTFRIYRPSVTLTQPNGGERWIAYSNQDITWATANVNTIGIDYSTNNGLTWINIAVSVPGYTGGYSWTIPKTPSTQCKIRLYDEQNPQVGDTSNSVFSIVVPTIKVVAPNGGENWKGGSKQLIKWTSSDINNLKFDFTTNNGLTWNTISDTITASLGQFEWTLPLLTSSQCKIKLSDALHIDIIDSSDNSFSIYRQFVEVTSPNGGETWIVGNTKRISWTSAYVNNIKIEISTNDGIFWSLIKNSQPASSLYFDWLVTNMQSTNCKIRITAIEDSTVNDECNNVFSIVAIPPSLTLSIHQNPALSMYSDIVVVSDSLLQSYPILKITSPRDSIQFGMLPIANTNRAFTAPFKFDTSGLFGIYAKIISRMGVEKDTLRLFNVMLAKPGFLNKLKSIDNLATLTIQTGSIDETTCFIADEEKQKDDNIYVFGPDKNYISPLMLEINYDSKQFPDPSKLFIYQLEDGNWNALRSQVFNHQNKVRSYASKLGKFKIVFDANFQGSNLVPVVFNLSQNYPNPFNPSTKINYDLAEDGYMSLIIYNILGEKVKTLISGYQLAGSYQTVWDGKNEFGIELSSGVYLIRCNANNFVSVKKMMLLR